MSADTVLLSPLWAPGL